ncbi:hypothetical protein [Paenibacillus konkukensis]|nr:hypothetical protein [Paenibacillus konkukensis]
MQNREALRNDLSGRQPVSVRMAARRLNGLHLFQSFGFIVHDVL